MPTTISVTDDLKDRFDSFKRRVEVEIDRDLSRGELIELLMEQTAPDELEDD